MSKEAVLAFFEKTRNDKVINQKFLAFGPEAPFINVIEMGKASGYEFSESDLIAVIKTQVEAEVTNREELTEADLENVAGGVQSINQMNPNQPTLGEVKIRFPRCLGTDAIV